MNSRIELLHRLAQKTDSRILLVVLDGLGDLPYEGHQSALTSAYTPNMDALAARSSLGLIDPVMRGITPGSGVAHLALLGYDPLVHNVGRGLLSALGLGIKIGSGDLCLRGNFATLDKKGNVTDRRAGRIPSSTGAALVEKLAAGIKSIDGVKISVAPEAEYRFVVVLRGAGLGEDISETDPQVTGVPPLEARGADKASRKSAKVINKFATQAVEILAKASKKIKGAEGANGVLMRGYALRPEVPSLQELYQLDPIVVASYPMYRGAASLVGMEMAPIDGEGEQLEQKIGRVEQVFGKHDLTFLHIKKTDSYGEDKDIKKKIEQIEAFDAVLPRLMALKPDVTVITGDHSTPAAMGTHSHHPVPVLLFGPNARLQAGKRLTEGDCLSGALGRLRSEDLMAEMLAHAGKLRKYGA